jgi:hypothetical protein
MIVKSNLILEAKYIHPKLFTETNLSLLMGGSKHCLLWCFRGGSRLTPLRVFFQILEILIQIFEVVVGFIRQQGERVSC